MKTAISANVIAQAFSSDGSRLAVGYKNGTIKFWDLNTWQETLSISAHQALEANFGFHLDFSSNGKYLASSAWDGAIKIWDPATGKELRSFKADEDYGHPLRFSPDGQRLASYGGRPLIIREVETGKEVFKVGIQNGNYSRVAFSPDGQMIAARGSDKVVKVWETKTGRELFAHKGGVEGGTLVFMEGGKKLVLLGDSATVLTWDLVAKPQQEPLAVTDQVAIWSRLSFDGTMLATSGNKDEKAHVWDVSTGKELFTLNAFDKNGYADGVGTVCFTTDGKQLVTASGDGRIVKIWDVPTQQMVQEFQPNLERRSFLSNVSRDGMRFTTGSISSSELILKVWDVKTKQELFSIKGDLGYGGDSEFSPDGSMVAISTA